MSDLPEDILMRSIEATRRARERMFKQVVAQCEERERRRCDEAARAELDAAHAEIKQALREWVGRSS